MVSRDARHKILIASLLCWVSASRVDRQLPPPSNETDFLQIASDGDIEMSVNVAGTSSNGTAQTLESPKHHTQGKWQVVLDGKWLDFEEKNQKELEKCHVNGWMDCRITVKAKKYVADLEKMVQRARFESGKRKTRPIRRLDPPESSQLPQRRGSRTPAPTKPPRRSFPIRGSKPGRFKLSLSRKSGRRSFTSVDREAPALEEDEVEESDDEAEGKPDSQTSRFNVHTPRVSSGETLKATQKALSSSKKYRGPPPDGRLTCKSFSTCEECVEASVKKHVDCAWDSSVGCTRKTASTSVAEQRCFVQTGDPLAAAVKVIWHLVFFEKIQKSIAPEAIEIMKSSRALLMEERSKSRYSYFMTEVDKEDIADVFVFGDIHGSAYSIVPILRGLLYGIGKDSPCKNGEEESARNSCLLIECKPGVQYVFLGDYIDRGEKMLGVSLMVMSLKLLCPNSVTLLRGNHETPPINARYGFLEQLRKEWDGAKDNDFVLQIDRFGVSWAVRHLDDEVAMTTNGIGLEFWYEANRAFGALALSALVKGKVWCMHGGPPEGGLKSFANPPPMPKLGNECFEDTGPICQLMWNDVLDVDNLKWEHNQARDIGRAFGRKGLEGLLDTDNLDLILRGHDYLDGVWQNGYECLFGNQICTLFTASQYLSAETRGTYMGDVEWENDNPGAAFWLHGKSDLQFRTRKGVKVTDIELNRGALKASVITFEGLVLRHVAQALGCKTCLGHVPTRNRLPIRLRGDLQSRNVLRRDRMLSNVWVADIQRVWVKKRSTEEHCDGGLGASKHTLVGDWSTTKAQCKLFCEKDISCNFVSYFEKGNCSSEACSVQGQPRRCRLSEICSTRSFAAHSPVQILEKRTHSANVSSRFKALDGSKNCGPVQSGSLVDRLRSVWSCKQACSRDSGCIAVAWYPDDVHCYLHKECNEIVDSDTRVALYLKDAKILDFDCSSNKCVAKAPGEQQSADLERGEEPYNSTGNCFNACSTSTDGWTTKCRWHGCKVCEVCKVGNQATEYVSIHDFKTPLYPVAYLRTLDLARVREYATLLEHSIGAQAIGEAIPADMSSMLAWISKVQRKVIDHTLEASAPAVDTLNYNGVVFERIPSHHCGGVSIAQWADGNASEFASPNAIDFETCKATCASHADCAAFVLRDEDKRCGFWKASAKPFPLNGHHCFKKRLAE